MRKSAWGTKSGREVVLAIWVRRAFLEDCLATAVCSDTFGPHAPCGGGSVGRSSGALGLDRSPLGNSGKSLFLRERQSSGSAASDVSLPSPRPHSTMEEAFSLGASALESTGDAGAGPVGHKGKRLEGEVQAEEEEEEEDRQRAVTTDTPSRGYYFGSPVSGCSGVGGGGGGGGRRRARSHSLTSSHNGRMTDGVRLHWEPERLPSGEKV